MIMVVLIKVGALAMQVDRMQAFVEALREVTGDHPVVLFPGGGAFADIVRLVDRQYKIGDDNAHDLAIRAMDSMGWLIARTCPAIQPTTNLAQIQLQLQQPRDKMGLPEIALWLPHTWLMSTDCVPHSWEVTSDSLAVFAGASVPVDWVGLAKVTDQLAKDVPFSTSPRLETSQLAPMMATSKNANDFGEWAVDPYLPSAIRATKMPCRIFDGRDIPNLISLLRGQGNPKYAEIVP